MRSILLTAAAAFVAGAVGAGAVLSVAQTAPPPGGQAEMLPPGAMPMGPHDHGAPGDRLQRGGAMARLRDFALIYRPTDRALSPPDVQKIAEAFLLWHGNHSWKVTDVAPTADGLVAFSVASPDGYVIAKFTMDPHTARVARTA